MQAALHPPQPLPLPVAVSEGAVQHADRAPHRERGHHERKQPGGCPTLYYRDKTATIRDLSQHRMWVALTAASGIISEHDFDRKDGTFSSRYLPGLQPR